MATTDNIELKYVLPEGITESTRIRFILTNFKGEAVPDASAQISIGSSSYTSLSSDTFVVPSGQRDIKIKLWFPRTHKDNERLVIDLEPLDNKEWFLKENFRQEVIYRSEFEVNRFIKPNELNIAEKEDAKIKLSFEKPLELDLHLNIRLSHITTNSAQVNTIYLKRENDSDYENLGSQKLVVLPSGLKNFELKIRALDDNVNVNNKSFEIVFNERNQFLTTNVNQNNKILVKITDTTNLPRGTLIRDFCHLQDLWGVYADGNGGQYNEIIKANSVQCGYVIPPQGQELIEFCAGTTKVKHVADGQDGYTKEIIAWVHESCTTPYKRISKEGELTPTTLVQKGSTSRLDPSKRTFTALNTDQTVTAFETMFGRWYFELEVYLPTKVHKFLSLGFQTKDHQDNTPLGDDIYSWFWSVQNKQRKHNNQIKQFLTNKAVKDKDVLSILLNNNNNSFTVWLNGVDLGQVYDNLPNDKLRFVLQANTDSWVHANFGQWQFKYTPPQGYYHGFGEVPNPPIDKDILISTRCEDTTKVDVYSDGKGGVYERSTINSVDCGWINPRPPKGTILGEFCNGYDKWREIADGNGGVTTEFVKYNSIECGYVMPSLGALTPTIWDDTKANLETTFSTDKLTSTFKGKIYTKHSSNFGVWYIEFDQWDSNSYLGLYWKNDQYDNIEFNGFIGFDPVTGEVKGHDLTNQLTTAVEAGSKIGITLDFLNQEASIYVNGVYKGILLNGLNHPNNTSRSYGFAAMTKVLGIASTVKANFGQLPLQYTPTEHTAGFGQTENIFLPRGQKIHEFCKRWDKWEVYTDGAGGNYNLIKTENDPDCGWYPDPEVGTVLGEICQGVDKYRKIATGNYEYRLELFKAKDRDCGYKPYGELLSWYCEGYNKMGKYSDGEGGHYIAVEQYNSFDCGSPIDPEGTVLREFCAGTSKVQHKADGLGGYVRHVVEHNSVECGYVELDPNTQDVLTPTVWQTPTGSNTTVLSNNKRDISALKRDGVKTEYSAMFGKWYFELTINIPTEYQKAPALGVALASYNESNWLGAHNNGWAWWPHDGTKYHADTQGFYNRNLVIENGDVISVKLDLKDNHQIEFLKNSQSLGVLYNNLPTDKKLHFVFNAVNDSYISANFGQNAFKYPVPDGYYPGFGVLKNPPPERGTKLTEFCQDVDLWGEYADGKFGSYNMLIATNQTACGYVPPTPPTGTVLRYECEGLNRVVVKADGSGGEYKEIYEINSTSCGYIPPPIPEAIYNYFDESFKSSETIVLDDKLQARVKGQITSKDANYSGLWYYEIEVMDHNTVVGVTSKKDNYSVYPGQTEYSSGWILSTKEQVSNGVKTPIENIFDVNIGDIISFMYDSVNERISARKNNNGDWIKVLDIPTLERDAYFLSFGNYDPNALTHVKVHFTEDSLQYEALAGYQKGWGVPRTRRRRKGTVINGICKNYDRWLRLYDGNDGVYEKLDTVNSTLCGYVPPPPLGTIIGYFCNGFNRHKKIADGSGGYTTELHEERSLLCGYKPANTLISAHCEGFNKIGKFSDGEGGFYTKLIEADSRDCGFNSGSSGGSYAGQLDPNLLPTDTKGLVFKDLVIDVNGQLVFKDRLN